VQSVTATNNFNCQQFGNPVNEVDCTGNLAAAANTVVTIVVTVPANTPNNTTLLNNAVVDPNNTIVETNEANNQASTTNTVTADINLNITKADAPDPVAPGGTLTYTLTVNNTGTGNATGVVVRDTLPVGVTLMSIMATNGFACAPGAVINCTNGTIAGGGSATITIVVTVNNNAPAMITNTATVDPDGAIVETNEADNTATATTTVTANVDLTITKTDSADPVAPGQVFTYTITASNTGTGNAANVLLVDNLPVGVTVLNIDVTSFGNTCATFGNPINQVRCTLDLTAGDTDTIIITVRVNSDVANGTTLVNTGLIDPDNTIRETNEGNNNVNIATTVTTNVELNVTKADDVDPVTSGNVLVYTLTVNNTGTGAATNVLVRDFMPVGVVILNVNTGASLFGCIVNFQSNVIDCTGNLAAGGSATITITVQVLAAAGTTLNNVVIVDPFNTIAETNEGNNADSETTVVN
jgi:uncharacterized repeat protein (TIGR01451 family)